MNEAILRLKEMKSGKMNKSVCPNISFAASEQRNTKSCADLTVEQIKTGILNAIESGNEFPKDSGYTWDYLLTSKNVGEC